ncbi:hypothetical protein [Kribbella sindirgiensis]|uniref:Head-to-tail adaptor n=1 Tax=Kribbella sindirgiensis TaxID=1124744 RepID=A0A4V2M1X8_9ACTN|nr:hypothetical protein [Kribbella sindirgiensis]TCC19959.1 hypothetical protein E0H50_37670 [Kribbella sindirgiensis]
MEPLAAIEELRDRLPFQMDEDEERDALGALEYLSDEARHYGSESWKTPLVTPPQVCRLVLRAAVRYMKNPDGFSQSRAGDETVAWSNTDGEDAGTPHFTDREIGMLKKISGSSKLYVADFTTGPRRDANCDVGYVPCGPGEAPFPYFSDPVEPW